MSKGYQVVVFLTFVIICLFFIFNDEKSVQKIESLDFIKKEYKEKREKVQVVYEDNIDSKKIEGNILKKESPIKEIVTKLREIRSNDKRVVEAQKKRFEDSKNHMMIYEKHKNMLMASLRAKNYHRFKMNGYKEKFIRLNTQKKEVFNMAMQNQKITKMKGAVNMAKSFKKVTIKEQINAQLMKGENHER